MGLVGGIQDSHILRASLIKRKFPQSSSVPPVRKPNAPALFFSCVCSVLPLPPRPSTVTCAPLLMFHNPFCPTAQAPPEVLRIPVKSTGNKSTQTLCVSDKASQTRKRASGRTKSRAAQTSTRFFQNNKYSQTEKCVAKKTETSTTQTGGRTPQPTAPLFPLELYGTARLFPKFKGMESNDPGRGEIDLYSFAGGYTCSQVGSQQSTQTSQSMGTTDDDQRRCDSPYGSQAESESSNYAVFSSCAE